jgi:hypothetical protein
MKNKKFKTSSSTSDFGDSDPGTASRAVELLILATADALRAVQNGQQKS